MDKGWRELGAVLARAPVQLGCTARKDCDKRFTTVSVVVFNVSDSINSN